MMRILLINLCFISFSIAFSQKKEANSIFKNDREWKNEVIHFPIDWAPNVKLNGFEELLFSPKWGDVKSSQFWSLVIGWKVSAQNKLTHQQITENFVSYFEGLMKPNHWAKEFPDPKIIATTTKNKKFVFTMRFFDGFHTGKMITIHAEVAQFWCKKSKKSSIIFRISPKDMKHEIWQTLRQIKRNPDSCNTQKKPNLIQLDSTWTKEIFDFPIRFAKEIPYQGFEEARFPKGWSDKNHPNFWSYTFAWYINLTKKLNEKVLEENLQTYFDGLSHYKDFSSIASFSKVKELKNTTFFKGKITIYDRFTTKAPLTLQVVIESKLCYKTKKTIILFKFSPKKWQHKTWKTLHKIKLTKQICE